MLTIPVSNLAVYKGSNNKRLITISGSSGVVNIENALLEFSVKATVSGSSIITKSSADAAEIEKTVPTAGAIAIKFVPEDTIDLSAGKYIYELWLTELGETEPILTGYFWIQNVAPTMVSSIRTVLDEGGELRQMVVKDEIIYPQSEVRLYVSRTRIKSVEGVYLLTDSDHSGTNYYTGGGFDSSKGTVWLGTPLPVVNERIRIDYVWEAGIDDDAINWHLVSSKLFVETYTGYVFEYGDGSVQATKAAEAMAIAGTIIGCILTINGANVAQMGYNFRLDEFEIQTKLWGEGMIAEALFNVYIREWEKWRLALGKAGYTAIVAPSVPKYNLTSLIGYSSESSEGGES